MTKRVQFLGHDGVTANAFIGLDREVTIDTDNRHLRVHDGVTPGGFRVLNRDENDNRYQARSVELDGLLGWEPNDRGILARQGPSNYNLLTFEVDTDQLVVEFANGFGGNTRFSLAPVILSDHQWDGVQTFTQSIVGNVTGNLLGNVVGNVAGNVTGNLTGNAVGSHAGSFTGTGVFSEITLPADCVNFTQLHPDVIAALDEAATFPGLICMFDGDVGLLPPNWKVCDGTFGTPNLVDKFIVCAGPIYPANTTGGSATHEHVLLVDEGGTHLHIGSVGGTSLTIGQLPSHNHGNGIGDPGTLLWNYGSKAAPASAQSPDNTGTAGTTQGLTESIGSGETHTHTLTVDSGGSHDHTGTTDVVSNLPPYYSLVYIKRIS